MGRERVLVVDPVPDQRRVCEEALREAGHPTECVRDTRAAILALRAGGFSLVVASGESPAGGLAFLKTLRKRFPEVRVILIDEDPSPAKRIEAMSEGAVDYLKRSFATTEFLSAVKTAFGSQSPSPVGDLEDEDLVRLFCRTRSPKMADAIELALGSTRLDCPVIIYGETGTGKGLCARAIHACSPRRDGPFLALNCTAIPEGLLESQLFGHVRGAFTGADADVAGFFEFTESGTLLLDEIGDVPPSFQAKLLHAVERKEFIPVGARQPVRANARLIFATAKNLRREALRGRFRLDLYYRLNVYPVFLPPLRERTEDIPFLAHILLRRSAERYGRSLRRLSPEAMACLLRYDWPGNVRELSNLIDLLVLTGPDDWIGPSVVMAQLTDGTSESPRDSLPGNTLKAFLRDQEQSYIERVLNATGWNVTQAARALGVSRATVHKKIIQYGLKPSQAN